MPPKVPTLKIIKTVLRRALDLTSPLKVVLYFETKYGPVNPLSCIDNSDLLLFHSVTRIDLKDYESTY